MMPRHAACNFRTAPGPRMTDRRPLAPVAARLLSRRISCSDDDSTPAVAAVLHARPTPSPPANLGAGPPVVGNRRVPGLRRGEVAALAGVSIDYYAKLEGGAIAGVSASVLDAIACALRLDNAERAPVRSRPRGGRGFGRDAPATPWYATVD